MGFLALHLLCVSLGEDLPNSNFHLFLFPVSLPLGRKLQERGNWVFLLHYHLPCPNTEICPRSAYLVLKNARGRSSEMLLDNLSKVTFRLSSPRSTRFLKHTFPLDYSRPSGAHSVIILMLRLVTIYKSFFSPIRVCLLAFLHGETRVSELPGYLFLVVKLMSPPTKEVVNLLRALTLGSLDECAEGVTRGGLISGRSWRNPVSGLRSEPPGCPGDFPNILVGGRCSLHRPQRGRSGKAPRAPAWGSLNKVRGLSYA